MRLKLKKEERKIHEDICSCVCWSSDNELYSISDDMTCQTWDIQGNNIGKAMEVESPVISFDWIISTKKAGELMAMG
jgi:WD40 repeat protein